MYEEEVNCVPAPLGLKGVTPSITQRLKGRKEELEHTLEKVNAALDALEKNPEVTKVLELVSKAGY